MPGAAAPDAASGRRKERQSSRGSPSGDKATRHTREDDSRRGSRRHGPGRSRASAFTKTGHVVGEISSAPHFCSGSATSRSGSPDLVAGAATNQKRSTSPGRLWVSALVASSPAAIRTPPLGRIRWCAVSQSSRSSGRRGDRAPQAYLRRKSDRQLDASARCGTQPERREVSRHEHRGPALAFAIAGKELRIG